MGEVQNDPADSGRRLCGRHRARGVRSPTSGAPTGCSTSSSPASTGDERRRDHPARHAALQHPAVALHLPGAAVPHPLPDLPGVRDAAALVLRQVRPELHRLRQLRLGASTDGIFWQSAFNNLAVADHRAVLRHGVRPGDRGARGPALVGQHRQVADLHADGDLVRRRLGDLEVRLRLPRPRHRADRRAQRASSPGSASRRRRGSPSRSGTRSC